MTQVTIYTDGGCSRNPGGDGAFAALLIHPKKTLLISGFIPAPTTNNRAEWAAVIEAISKLTLPCEVTVYSDSMICVNAINGRGKKDEKRGNRDLVQKYREVSRQHQVTAIHVRGHTGNIHNERCDTECSRVMQAKTNPFPQYSSKTADAQDGLY